MKARVLAFALAACSGQVAAQNAAIGCLVEPNEVVELGSPVVGLVDRIYVERGDLVREGQVLAQLQAEVERSAVSVAHTRAHRDAELDSAASANELAQRKRERAESLFRAKFISNQLRDEARTEAQLAEARLKQAREQRRQAHRELAFARSQLDQRTIRSPLSGVVVERYMARGERAEEKPILRLAALDPLKVEVIMPVAEFEKVRVGMPASVALQLPSEPQRQAKVTHVDRVMDAASNTFRVRLALPNPNAQLPAGVHCKVAFDTKAGAEKSSGSKPDHVSALAPARVALLPVPERPAPPAGPIQVSKAPRVFTLARSLDRARVAALPRGKVTVAVTAN